MTATPYPGRRQTAIGMAAVLMSRAAHAASPAQVAPALRLPPGGRPAVALTLDACPGAFDMRLARALVEQSVPASLFLTALWIARNPDGLAFVLAHRDLFSLQNHGARHLPPVLGAGATFGLANAGTMDAIRAEVASGAATVEAACGQAPTWFRGATALYSPDALAPIRAMGFGIAGFSLNADMGASLPAASVAARITKAQDRDVIIGHINQPLRPSGAGIAAGIAALKAQGMAFVKLPDQIAI